MSIIINNNIIWHWSAAASKLTREGHRMPGQVGRGEVMHCLWFYYIGLPSARPMAQALQLSFEYLLLIIIYNNSTGVGEREGETEERRKGEE